MRGIWRWAAGGSVAFLAGVGLAREALGCGPCDPAAEQAWAVVDGNEAERAKAIEALRAMGPRGLEALFREHGDLLKADGPSRVRLASAIDAVAAQKDAWASRLYWHTDFAAALAAAKGSGKPILSLRLLGRLDDGFC